MKPIQIVALAIIVIAVIGIVVASNDYTTYETFESALERPNKKFHVVGELVLDKPMYYNPIENPDYFSFYLKDEAGLVKKVVYHDPKPQDFERSDKIVITGSMTTEHFEASEILLKCPSKYIEDEIKLKEKQTAQNTP